jgi:hypothetical protein
MSAIALLRQKNAHVESATPDNNGIVMCRQTRVPWFFPASQSIPKIDLWRKLPYVARVVSERPLYMQKHVTVIIILVRPVKREVINVEMRLARHDTRVSLPLSSTPWLSLPAHYEGQPFGTLGLRNTPRSITGCSSENGLFTLRED